MRKIENKNYNYGINFTELLQVAFIVLKLCKIINWSWWWVLSPTLIGLGIGLIIFIILAILFWRE